MKNLLIGLFALCLLTPAFAQERILLEIDDEKVNAEEFLHIYKKNNTDVDAMSYEAMKEYMDLFINFKLKVHEAQVLRLDTTRAFKQELSGYRSQLAQPYLTDKKVEDELIAEAYERMKYDVSISHILIKLDDNASPKDTLIAWDKINQVYNKLKKGGDFVKLAKEHSQDESITHNDGNLGYRTVFGLVYEFESYMYETRVGEFSKPFRTRFGYHILMVNDKRPAKGAYKVAHIMMIVPQGSGSNLDKKAQEDIADLKKKIEDGADFAEIAKEHSQDRRTAEKGGELGWITVGGKMIKEFENAVFELEKPGDLAPILKTNYGYHLIKLLEIEPIKPFDQVKHDIKSKISNSARTSRSRESVIKTLKAEYNVVEYKENIKPLYKIVTDSIFEGTWKVDENLDLTAKLLSFSDKDYNQKDFVNYLMKFNRKQNPQNIDIFVDQAFDNFVNKMIMMYEEDILEDKYPAFKYLIKEYHDGILLFELTDKTVWSKAITDTTGLENFYNSNKEKYSWAYRYNVNQYQCKDEKTLNTLGKYISKSWSEEKLLAKLNKKDTSAVVLIKHELCEKGAKHEVDKILSSYDVKENQMSVKVVKDFDNLSLTSVKVVAPQIKTLNEARGVITADYQNLLEKQWIAELQAKYKVVLHDDVLKKIAE
ncbi:MAG: peptidylprolyl isomerase [Bacteroidales bacterium]|nr:peptidylprolyl isomerase [Bacteroidales bacterium]MDD4217234.1 peptidylprolyl isomerase [Bacteroidales bacterium]MDY0141063.1 peptidylprolyl isomerase [Bacteroidales bacterium]